jgi:hypothetical protein
MFPLYEAALKNISDAFLLWCRLEFGALMGSFQKVVVSVRFFREDTV